MKTGNLSAVLAQVEAGISSRKELAKRTGLTHVQVGNSLRRLRDLGQLTWPKRKHSAVMRAPERGCALAEVWK